MKTRIFRHQLGTVKIRIYNDGTATLNRTRYASYNSARRAMTKYYGFCYEVKE